MVSVSRSDSRSVTASLCRSSTIVLKCRPRRSDQSSTPNTLGVGLVAFGAAGVRVRIARATGQFERHGQALARPTAERDFGRFQG